jgi:hypothetical protein
VSPPESSANLTAQGQKSDCPVALRREDFRRILREPEYLLVKRKRWFQALLQAA